MQMEVLVAEERAEHLHALEVEADVVLVRHADAADSRAAALMSAHGMTYKDALLRASRDLRDEALAPLTAALGG